MCRLIFQHRSLKLNIHSVSMGGLDGADTVSGVAVVTTVSVFTDKPLMSITAVIGTKNFTTKTIINN